MPIGQTAREKREIPGNRITMPASEIQRQAYREKFRSVHHEAFQAWLDDLLTALYAPGDYQAVRKTAGDGGLDAYLISEQRVYQAYAPARNAEVSDPKTAKKIGADFATARSTLGGKLKAWTFVHNHPEGKLGKRSAEALTRLRAEYPEVEVSVLDIDSLWTMLANLSDAQLAKLFGPSGAVELDAELRSRLTFLTSIEDDSDVSELEERSKELIDCVADLKKGKRYSKLIGRYLRRSHFWVVSSGESESHMSKQQLDDDDRDYRDQLRKARDPVYALVERLLTVQKW